LRGHGDFGEADSGAASDQHLAFSRFPAAGDDVLTRLDRFAEDDCVSFDEVCSTITTASAPFGTAAPVMI